VWALAFCTVPAWAQESQQPAEEPADTIEEVIIVSASRTEQPVNEAPATVSVITSQDIAQTPADDYGDLLRNVPGLNVAQISARDIQITGRGATNSLATSQLVLLDGRSLYLDFFGFVMWDFLPVNTSEIKQIEVVRGPGSAVWGANAMSGVVNLITKKPKEMVGTTVQAGGGDLGTAYGSISHAGASGNFGYKLAGSYYEQDPFPRPTGAIPGSPGGGAPLTYEGIGFGSNRNEGTEQPKIDSRFDWDTAGGSTISVGGGYAGTAGIIHTGIGPFTIDNGSNLSYGKVDWNRRALHVGFFANFLDADSVALLTRGTNGQFLPFAFSTDTYHLEASNTSLPSERFILTYGANVRSSDFELQIAPRGTKKDEWGAFGQAEILLGEHSRWVVGARYDDIDPIGGVASPRTSLVIAPSSNHAFRLSYNQAFRAPSVINSYLQTAIILATPPLGPFGQIPFVALANGNVDLSEEKVQATEVGYTGSFGNGYTATVAVYRNKTEDSIDFYQAAFYSFANPPAGFPAPLRPLLAVPPPNGLANSLPSLFSYRNIGETIDQGAEFSLNYRSGSPFSWFANYSYQKDPEFTFTGLSGPALAAQLASQNKPPKSRWNVGMAYDPGRWFVNANVNHQDDAYWADVLNVIGVTEAFTNVNASVGMRLMDERMTISVIGSNLTDEKVQQHIFGDIITQKITGQISLRF
jgi:iron complex outermembrane receptor protein